MVHHRPRQGFQRPLLSVPQSHATSRPCEILAMVFPYLSGRLLICVFRHSIGQNHLALHLGPNVEFALGALAIPSLTLPASQQQHGGVAAVRWQRCQFDRANNTQKGAGVAKQLSLGSTKEKERRTCWKPIRPYMPSLPSNMASCTTTYCTIPYMQPPFFHT